MKNHRFVVLTGHLNDYPLSDLIGILRHQQKTGRLLVEYPQTPAIFFFQEGELVDVQLGSLSGLQAICFAVAQPASPFNFNPLIQPSRRSIDRSLQRVVSELLGCWDDSPPQIDVTVEKTLPSAPAKSISTPEIVVPALPPAMEALDPATFTHPETNQNRMVLLLTAVGIMLLGISSIIAVTSVSRSRVDAKPTTSKPEVSTEFAAEQRSTANSEASQQTVENSNPKAREVKPTYKLDRNAGGDLPSASQPTSSKEKIVNPPSPTAATSLQTTPPTKQDNEKPSEGADKDKSELIDVVMQIENGRVSQAEVSNHKAGMDGYEAMALRIARQRRYSQKTTGQERVRIRVVRPD